MLTLCDTASMARKEFSKSLRFPIGPIEGDVLSQLSAKDLMISLTFCGGSNYLLYKSAYRRARAKQATQRAFKSLAKKGYIKISGDSASLTDKGRGLASVLNAPTIDQKNWDGWWWIFMYDIPISHNDYRYEIIWLLKRGGFRKMQLSTWVHPYENAELREYLSEHASLKQFFRYFRAPAFETLRTIDDWKKLKTR